MICSLPQTKKLTEYPRKTVQTVSGAHTGYSLE